VKVREEQNRRHHLRARDLLPNSQCLKCSWGRRMLLRCKVLEAGTQRLPLMSCCLPVCLPAAADSVLPLCGCMLSSPHRGGGTFTVQRIRRVAQQSMHALLPSDGPGQSAHTRLTAVIGLLLCVVRPHPSSKFGCGGFEPL